MRHHYSGRVSTQGFTLIELMVTVVIVSILAAIAIPSYQSFIVRTNRADAQKALLTTSQAMERYFIANNSYASAGADAGSPSVGLKQSPDSGTAVYNITFSGAPTQTAYTLIATPTATSTNAKDGCLKIDSTGARTWSGEQATAGACGSTYSKAWTDR